MLLYEYLPSLPVKSCEGKGGEQAHQGRVIEGDDPRDGVGIAQEGVRQVGRNCRLVERNIPSLHCRVQPQRLCDEMSNVLL